MLRMRSKCYIFLTKRGIGATAELQLWYKPVNDWVDQWIKKYQFRSADL